MDKDGMVVLGVVFGRYLLVFFIFSDVFLWEVG